MIIKTESLIICGKARGGKGAKQDQSDEQDNLAGYQKDHKIPPIKLSTQQVVIRMCFIGTFMTILICRCTLYHKKVIDDKQRQLEENLLSEKYCRNTSQVNRTMLSSKELYSPISYQYHTYQQQFYEKNNIVETDHSPKFKSKVYSPQRQKEEQCDEILSQFINGHKRTQSLTQNQIGIYQPKNTNKQQIQQYSPNLSARHQNQQKQQQKNNYNQLSPKAYINSGGYQSQYIPQPIQQQYPRQRRSQVISQAQMMNSSPVQPVFYDSKINQQFNNNHKQGSQSQISDDQIEKYRQDAERLQQILSKYNHTGNQGPRINIPKYLSAVNFEKQSSSPISSGVFSQSNQNYHYM